MVVRMICTTLTMGTMVIITTEREIRTTITDGLLYRYCP
jgi:hypothetical protein